MLRLKRGSSFLAGYSGNTQPSHVWNRDVGCQLTFHLLDSLLKMLQVLGYGYSLISFSCTFCMPYVLWAFNDLFHLLKMVLKGIVFCFWFVWGFFFLPPAKHHCWMISVRFWRYQDGDLLALLLVCCSKWCRITTGGEWTHMGLIHKTTFWSSNLLIYLLIAEEYGRI